MEKEEPFYKKTWFIVISAFILLGVFGNISEEFDQNSKSQTESTTNSSTNEYEVENNADEYEESLRVENLDSHWSEHGNILHITGKIKNTRSSSLKGVGVEISLLDADGNLVGSTLDYVNNVAAGQTWKFDAGVLSAENVSSYEVAEIIVHDY